MLPDSYLRVTKHILKPISLSSWLGMLKDFESVSQRVSEIIEYRATASQLKSTFRYISNVFLSKVGGKA